MLRSDTGTERPDAPQNTKILSTHTLVGLTAMRAAFQDTLLGPFERVCDLALIVLHFVATTGNRNPAPSRRPRAESECSLRERQTISILVSFTVILPYFCRVMSGQNAGLTLILLLCGSGIINGVPPILPLKHPPLTLR